jgi:hypothetical protein
MLMKGKNESNTLNYNELILDCARVAQGREARLAWHSAGADHGTVRATV